VAVALLAIVVQSCSGSTSEETGRAADTTVVDGTSGSGGGTVTTKKAQTKVSYPAGGPVDQVVPPQEDAYGPLAAGRCGDLARMVDGWQGRGVDERDVLLYRGAARACLKQWGPATADYDRLAALNRNLSCEKRVVFDWLKALVEARRQDPGYDPILVPGSGAPRCPVRATTTSEAPTKPTTTNPTTTKPTASTSTTA